LAERLEERKRRRKTRAGVGEEETNRMPRDPTSRLITSHGACAVQGMVRALGQIHEGQEGCPGPVLLSRKFGRQDSDPKRNGVNTKTVEQDRASRQNTNPEEGQRSKQHRRRQKAGPGGGRHPTPSAFSDTFAAFPPEPARIIGNWRQLSISSAFSGALLSNRQPRCRPWGKGDRSEVTRKKV